jgi:hypothetical protein
MGLMEADFYGIPQGENRLSIGKLLKLNDFS